MPHTWFVDRLMHTRGTLRMGKHDELHWKVLWSNGETTREPLGSLISKTTCLEDVAPVLEDYITVASKNTCTRRKCITCSRKARNGAVFCKKTKRCTKYYNYVCTLLPHLANF